MARADNSETIQRLFEAAWAQDSVRRSSFLKEQCADPSVRAQVERLLVADEPSEPAPAVETPGTTRGLSEGDRLAGRFRIVRFIAA